MTGADACRGAAIPVAPKNRSSAEGAGRAITSLSSSITHCSSPRPTRPTWRSSLHEASELGVYAVCVSPSLVSAARRDLVHSTWPIATVVGFPSGKHVSTIKAAGGPPARGRGRARKRSTWSSTSAPPSPVTSRPSALTLPPSAKRFPIVVLKVIVESAALLDLAGGTDAPST